MTDARPGRLQRIRNFFAGRGDSGLADSEAWAPGDLAECLVHGRWVARCGCCTTAQPGFGDVHAVHAVCSGTDFQGIPCTYLVFARWPGSSFNAKFFRKLTPRADAVEAADAAFLEQLRPADLPIAATAPQRPIAHRPRRIFP